MSNADARGGMREEGYVREFDSRGEDYHRAFAVFLAHTDQKTRLKGWIDEAVAGLPRRATFIDAGAGTGQVTAWYVDAFDSTIAIEPNPSLRDELARACPTAEVLSTGLIEAAPSRAADLVLCSHVFYYVDRDAWLANLEALASWVGEGGMLALILQDPGTDCMRMLRHFTGRSFDLEGLRREFDARQGARFESRIETVPATIVAADPGDALTIAEFVLNVLPIPTPIDRADVVRYLDDHARGADGVYRLSCTQEILIVRPRTG
ncbi:methyltransferase domain-containing protein [Aquisphaera insulae]|uniref:methyltransferase domain-containing protein n=1 Tax=Aquisphaera insulae TaxID=2712864 RepID=UPI0013EAF6FD|nr:methyltransferase domain-containing protein [Aquisphaera insulae]